MLHGMLFYKVLELSYLRHLRILRLQIILIIHEDKINLYKLSFTNKPASCHPNELYVVNGYSIYPTLSNSILILKMLFFMF